MRREDTMLAEPSAHMNEYERQLVTQISQYGWRSTHVNGSDNSPCFTYTTGFYLSLTSPEILVFDFPGKLAHDVFGQVYRELQAGRIFSEAAPEEKIISGETVYFLRSRKRPRWTISFQASGSIETGLFHADS
jgi:hypothetical protein